MQPPDHPPDPELVEDLDRPEQLDPDVLGDADALCEVIESWVHADAEAAERLRHIELLLDAINNLASEEVWDLVHEVIACIHRRQEDLSVLVARRAFEHGRRHRLTPADEPANDAELPALDAAVLADGTRLGMAIDTVLRTDDGLRGLSTLIVRAWSKIKRKVDDETWQDILDLENVLTERAALAQEILVGWAFRAGRRR